MKFLLLVLAGALLVAPIARPSIVPAALTSTVEDFGAYWCAATIARQSGNPYEPEQLRTLESAIEPGRPQPLITYSPPWAITLLVPWTLVEYPAARWLFMMFQLVAMALCAAVVCKLYGGNFDRLGLAWLMAFTFYPTLQLVALGQMSIWTLLGLTLFLHFNARNRDGLAGAALVLTLVKPHNVLILAIAVFLHTLFARRWNIIWGVIAGTLSLSLLAIVVNPSFFTHYRETMTNRPPSMMMPPTIGTYLRLAFGRDQFWLAFVPTIFGVVWAIYYTGKHRRAWYWPERIPPLIFASIVCSPYAWIYDSAILLIPLWATFATGTVASKFWLAVYFTSSAVGVAANVLKVEEYWFVWFPMICTLAWWSNPRGT